MSQRDYLNTIRIAPKTKLLSTTKSPLDTTDIRAIKVIGKPTPTFSHSRMLDRPDPHSFTRKGDGNGTFPAYCRRPNPPNTELRRFVSPFSSFSIIHYSLYLPALFFFSILSCLPLNPLFLSPSL